MANKNDAPLFAQNPDPFGVGRASDDLFATPRPVRPLTGGLEFGERLLAQDMYRASRPPTRDERKAAAEAERNRQVALVTAQMNAMRDLPEWVGASAQKREELLQSWSDSTYSPMLQNIQDPELRLALMRLPDQILKPDVTLRQEAVDASSQLADTGLGIQNTMLRQGQTFLDRVPAAAASMREENLRAAIAQHDADSARRPDLYPPEQKAVLLEQLRAAQAEQAAQAADEQARAAEIAANRAQQSIGQAERDLMLRESQAQYGDFFGTLANASPAGVAQLVAEQAPNILPMLAAAPTGPVGMAAVGAALTGGDALSSAVEQVQQLSDAQLQQLPAYKELRDGGLTEADAKRTLSLRAGQDAGVLGALLGAALGPLGAEAGVARALAGTAAPVAGRTTAQIAGGVALRGAGRTAAEGIEEGGTQVAANLGQQQATGAPVDLTGGVGEAAAMGILAGGPLGIGGEVAGAVRETRQPAPAPTVAPATTPTTPIQEVADARPTAEGQITDVPSAQEAAAAGFAASTTAVPTAPDAAAIDQLRTTLTDLRSRAGTTLTAPELDTLFTDLYAAETSGVSAATIQAGLDSLGQVRGLAVDAASPSLAAAYDGFVASRAQADIAAVTPQVVMSFATGDFINGTTDVSFPGADYTGPATSAGLNSLLAAPPTGSRSAAGAISQNVGGIDSAPTVAGPSRAGGDSAATDAGNAAAVAGMGLSAGAIQLDSRPSDQPVPVTSPPISVGERGDAGSAGQRPADGGGPASVSGSPAGSDLSVGQEVQYQGQFQNAPVITGTVTAVNPNGTFSMRSAGGSTLGNLPVSNIQGSPNAVQEPSPTGEVLRQPEPEMGLQEVGQGNAQGQEATQAGQIQEVATVPALRTDGATPQGRDLAKLSTAAERLYDARDGAYAADAAALEAAIAGGDVVKVDEISEYLYAEGMRQFKPAQENTGSARVALDAASATALSGAERMALQREYDLVREELPPELATFSAFRDAMVQDTLLTEAGEAPLNSVFERLSQVARSALSKLAKALATIIAAITISNTFPINDAVAAQGGAAVQSVTQVAEMSPVASTVNSWVTQTKDSAGQRYIIADKASGQIHIMDAKGSVLATAPALYGAKTGDGMSVGETPAGVFTLWQEAAPESYGGDVQGFATDAKGDVYAIHRVLTNNPKQNRLGRLASKTADDNRVSLGCINIPADTYNQYLASGFKGKLYIIPDQRELADVFKGIEEVQAKQELAPQAELPADLSDQTTGVFESSTQAQAEKDPRSLSAVAVALADAGYGMATSDAAALSNMPADRNNASALWAMAGLAGIGRARRHTDTPSAKRKVSKVDFHAIEDVDTPPAVVASGRPSMNGRFVQSATTAAIERASDADHRFIRWTDEAGLVRAGGDYNSAELVQSLKRIEGTRHNILEQAKAVHMRPLEDMIVAESARLGISPDVVARDMGTWATMEHIPEANAQLRSALVAARDEAIFSTDQAAYDEAVEKLAAFDAYQAGGETRVPTAGGFTDTQAAAKKQQISAHGYDPLLLRQFQQGIVSTIKTMTDTLIRAGVLTQEEVDAWPRFENYVPMYVAHEQPGEDVYIGAGEFSTGRNYRRQGAAAHYASHAYVTLQQFMFRTASAQASAEFRFGLHKTYGELKKAGNTYGLQRINLASDFIPKEAKDATGMFYREATIDGQGQLKTSTYKYYFDDPRIMDGLRLKNAEPSWGLTKMIGRGTRAAGVLMTVARPVFAPVMWVKDSWDKAAILASRTIYDSNGKALPAASTALRVGLTSYNPVNVAAIAKARITGARSSPIVQALDELRALGGVSMYQQMLQSSATNMQKELRGLRGWRRMPKAVMDAMHGWNAIWAEATAAGAYMALRQMNVAPKQAAFSVLDTFNVYNRGYWKNTAQAFYPFVGAAFESGRNLTMSLATARGRKVLAAQAMLSIGLYGLLSSMAPDDDDRGNLLDATKLHMLAGSVPVYMPDGSSVKVPMPFGQTKLAWVMGAGMYRWAEGVDNLGDVVSATLLTLLQEVQPLDTTAASNADGVVSGLIAALTPTLASPLVELEMNRDGFGRRIYGNAPAEGFKSDSARASTPQVWTDIAQTMQQLTGMDSYPESIRHMATSYFYGPAAAIATALESDTLYTRGGRLTTKQEIGPVGVALGLQAFWDNGDSGVTRQYFDTQERATEVLRKYRVAASDPDNKPGTKAASAAMRVQAAGGSIGEALLVQYAIEAESAREKENTRMKGITKGFKNIDADMQWLAPEYKNHEQEQEKLMLNFIRQARGLK